MCCFPRCSDIGCWRILDHYSFCDQGDCGRHPPQHDGFTNQEWHMQTDELSGVPMLCNVSLWVSETTVNPTRILVEFLMSTLLRSTLGASIPAVNNTEYCFETCRCILPKTGVCGNGIRESQSYYYMNILLSNVEECDDGNEMEYDGCSTGAFS